VYLGDASAGQQLTPWTKRARPVIVAYDKKKIARATTERRGRREAEESLDPDWEGFILPQRKEQSAGWRANWGLPERPVAARKGGRATCLPTKMLPPARKSKTLSQDLAGDTEAESRKEEGPLVRKGYRAPPTQGKKGWDEKIASSKSPRSRDSPDRAGVEEQGKLADHQGSNSCPGKKLQAFGAQGKI